MQEATLLHLQEVHPPHADLLNACGGFELAGLLFCFGQVCVEVGQGRQVEEGGLGGWLGGQGRGEVSGEFGHYERRWGSGRVAHRTMLRLLFIIGPASTTDQPLPDDAGKDAPNDAEFCERALDHAILQERVNLML